LLWGVPCTMDLLLHAFSFGATNLYSFVSSFFSFHGYYYYYLYFPPVYDHLAELQHECTEGRVAQVYLHPTLNIVGALEGSFATDLETGHGDRKRIFRIWTAKSTSGAAAAATASDSLVVSRIERDLELEQRLRREASPPFMSTTNKARVEETKAAATKKKRLDSSMKEPKSSAICFIVFILLLVAVLVSIIVKSLKNYIVGSGPELYPDH
jgi:hypothetical protein